MMKLAAVKAMIQLLARQEMIHSMVALVKIRWMVAQVTMR
jgi:hypothetical protein